MPKLTLIFAAVFLAFSTIAYAQQQENPSYSQQVQKLFDQTNKQAKTQFDKTYPKPVAPKIESPAESNTNTGTYRAPITPRPYEQPAPTQTPSYTSAPKSPEVAISQGEKTEKKEGPGVNIFLPPSNNNTAQTQSTPNPYR